MFYFMWKVPRYIAIKYMCEILYKRSKESNVEGVEDTLYRFQCIKCMLEMLEMVFVAFMQHCMQSTDFMLKTSKILCTLYTVAPRPTRREGSL